MSDVGEFAKEGGNMGPKTKQYKVTLEFRQKGCFLVSAINAEDAEDQALRMMEVNAKMKHHDTVVEKL